MHSRVMVSTMALAGLALGLGLVGCASEPEPETGAAARSTDGAEVTEGAASSGESAAERHTGEAQQTSDEQQASHDRSHADPELGSSGEGLRVSAVGAGPVGLVSESAVSGGGSQTFEGKLITGPGDCFALTVQGRPLTLVFDAGSELAPRGQKPAVTSPALGTVRVGEHMRFEGEAVPLAETVGVPDRCTEGADRVVRVIR